METPHHHFWRVSSHTGPDEAPRVTLRCDDCREDRKVTFSAEWGAIHSFAVVHPSKVHAAWHDFRTRFLEEDTGEWKMIGFELMDAVDKWADAWPEHVRVAVCDDDSFMSSSIVLIRHCDEESWMGTTMVTIPQSGHPPCRMFLYPGHVESLYDELRDLSRARGSRRGAEQIAAAHRNTADRKEIERLTREGVL